MAMAMVHRTLIKPLQGKGNGDGAQNLNQAFMEPSKARGRQRQQAGDLKRALIEP